MTLLDRLRTHGLMPVVTRVAAEQAVPVHVLPDHDAALRALGRALVERGWSTWSAGNLLGLPRGWDAPPVVLQAPEPVARAVAAPTPPSPLATPPRMRKRASPKLPPVAVNPAPALPPEAPPLRTPPPRRAAPSPTPPDVPQKRRGVPRTERLAALRARREEEAEDLDLALEALADDVDDAPASPWDPDGEDAPDDDETDAPTVNDQAHRFKVMARIREDRERTRLRTGYYDRERDDDDTGDASDADDLADDDCDDAPEVPVEEAPVLPEEPDEPHVPHERKRLTDQVSRAELDLGRALYPEEDHHRPKTRGECADAPRPCPYVSCKYHLYLDVDADRIVLNFPAIEPEDMKHSCALDIADLGGVALEIVGRASNVTRERIRQIEAKTLKKIRGSKRRLTILKGGDL